MRKFEVGDRIVVRQSQCTRLIGEKGTVVRINRDGVVRVRFDRHGALRLRGDSYGFPLHNYIQHIQISMQEWYETHYIEGVKTS